jgi:aspartate/methionine/tyrosine aminotransferase
VTRAAAPYMEWAKTRPRPAIDLAGSNLLACTLDDLPGAREAVDIAGESPDGYPPLLAAIGARYGVVADRVATAGGCSGANFLACAALLEPGDEVLCETPYYDPMPAAARMLGATVRTFARRLEDGYDVDAGAIAALLTPRTRLVLLSNPHNPSGALARPESLRALALLAGQRGFHVLVDEVYLDTVFDGRPAPAATLSPAFVSTNSLTKAYGLASLRCGWTIASAEVTRRIRRARDIVDVWAPMPADRLSVVAFENLDRLAARAKGIVEANRSAVAAWLAGRPDLSCAPSRATVAFPRLVGSSDAGPFADRLFAETGTAVAPGRFFGAPAHVRIAFGGRPDLVAAGLAAISSVLDRPAPA